MMNLAISSAKYVRPLSIELQFSDGSSRTVNVGEFIRKHPHPQYNRYLDEKKFKQFKIEMGNVVWGKNWDLVFSVEDLYRGVLSD